MDQLHYLMHTLQRTIKSPITSKETASMAVVETNQTDVAAVEDPFTAGEEMVETMDGTVAHLDEAMVGAVDLHSNLNTRSTQANQCVIGVE